MSAPRRPSSDWATLIEEIEAVRGDMTRLVEESRDALEEVHPDHQASARNLLHYLALRNRDLRPLQARLAEAGVSSLGRADSHVLAAVDAVLHVLQRLIIQPGGQAGPSRAERSPNTLDLKEGQRLLDAHYEAVLGPRPAGRTPAIMVTMPTAAAEEYTLVSQLVEAGMDCMRVNCAHDTPDEWAKMIDHLRRASEQHNRSSRVLMDLAGPKVRTGPIESGSGVVKFKPSRDAHGRVVEPAHVWLYDEARPQPAPTAADASLPVDGNWLRKLKVADRITFDDARGSSRTLRVVVVDREGCWVESRKTAYVEPGTTLRVARRETQVGALQPAEPVLQLAEGDALVITRPDVPGRNAVRNERGRVLTPATIGCTAERVFEDVQSGDPIWFDDGKIGGVVERKRDDRLQVRITRTKPGGARLASEKGINLPETELNLPALTDKDREDLGFVATHADMVALSFVNTVDDVRELRTLLEPLGDTQPAIVLKIETQRGFENLPAMLIEAMKAPRCGVMIARGDLAVECGFERLAEVQEEILWMCEAAHVPVIWATQVLESLAKEGLPSRAEVTDAAMAHRAECVMLNKGPYIVEAVKALDDILRRMHGHQAKKQPMLRRLGLARNFSKTRAALEPDAPVATGT
ncbi:MAG TPA: pyruvate kinase [Vicinamibacterales bacterium]|nr:pyruvate kinase [Vicinamibacterales bacterium]